ncbi:hypothetical protein F4780DRAFT_740522 [Xylariomycetidae sp. FL0641]|nr:hypothetical protein F4780DRAFT_740522 [Xylariomycetidae sp. FL0641]
MTWNDRHAREPRTPGPIVILLCYPGADRVRLEKWMEQHHTSKPKLYELDTETSIDEVFTFLDDPNPKVILVDFNCGFSLPFPNVRAVISWDAAFSACFYRPMVRFSTRYASPTVSQCHLAEGWAYKSNAKLYASPFRETLPSEIEDLQGRLEHFCLLTARFFRSLRCSSLPIPTLRLIERHHGGLVREVARRLKLNKCLEDNDDLNDAVLTPLGHAMLRYLQGTAGDNDSSRLCLLLAHIDVDPLSLPVKRILIRLEALIYHQMVQVSKISDPEITKDASKVVSIIRPFCAGEGGSQHRVW